MDSTDLANMISCGVDVEEWEAMKAAKPDIQWHKVKRCGESVSRLVGFIGFDAQALQSKKCNCLTHIARMNKEGVEWCKANVPTIVGWFRESADKLGLVFIGSQMQWLVELSILLVEEDREPNWTERVFLRGMRLGNRLVNGKPAETVG